MQVLGERTGLVLSSSSGGGTRGTSKCWTAKRANNKKGVTKCSHVVPSTAGHVRSSVFRPRAPRFPTRGKPSATADIPYDTFYDVGAGAAVTSESVDNASEWPLGATHSAEQGGVYIRAWIPHGKRVFVEVKKEGETEKFDRVPLHQEGKEPYWGGLLKGIISIGSKYRLVIEPTWNDCYEQEGYEVTRRDPYAREADFDSTWCYVPAPPSAFPWATPPLPPNQALVPWHKLMLYELHVGSFSPEGTFEGATRRLEHIKALGFNCVQLMPITEFGGLWGYNPRQLLTVHSPWGSADDVRRLVDRCHELGLAVLVDVVLNHGASKLNNLWMWDGYGPKNNGGIYFETGKDTPWGRQFSFDKPEVQAYLLEACRMWLREYNVDGLRWDSVENMPRELVKDLNKTLQAEFPAKLNVAELTPETSEAITSAKFNSCWRHTPHFDALKLHKKWTDDWLGLIRHMVDIPEDYPNGYNGVVSILGSHDQVGCRKEGAEDSEGHLHRYFQERLGTKDNWHARAQTRMWWAVNAIGRSLPMMFQGSEFLQRDWWNCEANNRNVHMQWPPIPLEAYAGGEVEGLREEDVWSLHMARCVRAINALRANSEALTSEELRVVHEDFDGRVMGVLRGGEGGASLVVINASENQWEEQNYQVKVRGAPYAASAATLVFNSQAEEFGGWEGSATAGTVQVADGRLHLSIPKWSVLVYELER
uniref:1,4-alpha-glucan branching enzyme n=1 Tax=Pyramimonas obovata TaxID=1411642 RepID=A0A7S0N4K5_9CHLO|mmetsp:Transcript_18877/g.41353  ORF Transcript_18877/g.41353 Transcript_18877/m.41353 type:complete len:705 (+) Transcript_18877:125-2239(+)|eukprot:CAMPEP_0118942716 /NCGR_PEP_ID=MMETSP1169-20130426/36714_1 /TAXON_ID=36882 /ORGANISM="Pyramimonas obovata, Strain CCMP722" /LENGTH=704 /DNA_ID=CAMNT_0006887781 /DNA_START=40 /DNA_END=2154 /DNA_ORIENTATION=+